MWFFKWFPCRNFCHGPRSLGEMMQFDAFWLKIWPYGVGVLLIFDFSLCQIPYPGLGGGGVGVLINWCVTLVVTGGGEFELNWRGGGQFLQLLFWAWCHQESCPTQTRVGSSSCLFGVKILGFQVPLGVFNENTYKCLLTTPCSFWL